MGKEAAARRRSRPLAFWVAVGGVSLIAHTALNLAADWFPDTGLDTFRDYLTRRNG